MRVLLMWAVRACLGPRTGGELVPSPPTSDAGKTRRTPAVYSSNVPFRAKFHRIFMARDIIRVF